MQQPNRESAALREIAARLLPGNGWPEVKRAETGVSTPVYRIRRGETTLYLRLAEKPEASLAPEALAHDLLRARGVRAPEVVYFQPIHDELQRSVLVTTEIPGSPISRNHRGVDLSAVLLEAGRDLAIINEIGVEGFGWVRRDRLAINRLEAELPTLSAFALGDLETHLAALPTFLTAREIDEIRRTFARNDAWLDADLAVLAHGDLDASHIYHLDGKYTGIIDFGEIRGTDRFYDLGHFALHDGETIPYPVLPHLLKGYQEFAPLPPDHEQRIQLWSLLIGVRALARSANWPQVTYQSHLTGAIRSALAALSS
jgi:aminoglycoside phosphotransferase (APT) family kinase protein